MFLIILVIFTF